MEALIKENMIKWAIDRANVSLNSIAKKLSIKQEKLEKWLRGEEKPTFKQAQKLAQKLHIPFAYLFLSVPPQEDLLFPDFRTIKNNPTYQNSINLIKLLNDIDRKQKWYKEYLIENGYQKLSFVNSADINIPAETLVKDIYGYINFKEIRRKTKNKEDYIYQLTKQVENIGIIVLRSSYVGTNTQNSIKVEELRGLAIADDYAPFIFINSADSKTAQVFTLAHELVHIWIGKSAISDIDLNNFENQIEQYCNNVAAELLINKNEFYINWNNKEDISKNLERLSNKYFVSKFVILKKAYDLNILSYKEYKKYYKKLTIEWEEIKKIKENKGGNYYNSKYSKESKTFSQAVIEATLEGKILYRDALDLLNIKSMKTFQNYIKNF